MFGMARLNGYPCPRTRHAEGREKVNREKMHSSHTAEDRNGCSPPIPSVIRALGLTGVAGRGMRRRGG